VKVINTSFGYLLTGKLFRTSANLPSYLLPWNKTRTWFSNGVTNPNSTVSMLKN